MAIINFRIKINSDRDGRDVPFPTNNNDGTSTINFRTNLGAGNILVCNEANANPITAVHTRAAGHVATPNNVAGMDLVSIKCPTKKAEQIYSLFLARANLKGAIHDENGEFNVMIKGTYDDGVGLVHATTNTTIELLDNNIPGNAEDIITINPTDETANGFPIKATGGNPAQNALNDLDAYKSQIVKFFKIKHKFDSFFTFANPADLDKKDISVYSDLETEIAELLTYVDNSGVGQIVANDPKKTIYNFSSDDGTNYSFIKTAIDKQINLLREFKL